MARMLRRDLLVLGLGGSAQGLSWFLLNRVSKEGARMVRGKEQFLSEGDLSEKALAAFEFPDGARLTGPIVEAPAEATFIAHSSGFTANRRPMIGSPYASVTLDARTGSVLSRSKVRKGDAVAQLFPKGLVALEEHVMPSTSEEALTIAYRIQEALQPLVFSLYAAGKQLATHERADVKTFTDAMWQTMWTYERVAYEKLGGEFMRWLEENAG